MPYTKNRLLTRAALIGAATVRERLSFNTRSHGQRPRTSIVSGLRRRCSDCLGKFQQWGANTVLHNADHGSPQTAEAKGNGCVMRRMAIAKGLRIVDAGASKVVIGEGPGHQRDTELVVQALNRDELLRVKLKANYSGIGETCAKGVGANADLGATAICDLSSNDARGRRSFDLLYSPAEAPDCGYFQAGVGSVPLAEDSSGAGGSYTDVDLPSGAPPGDHKPNRINWITGDGTSTSEKDQP